MADATVGRGQVHPVRALKTPGGDEIQVIHAGGAATLIGSDSHVSVVVQGSSGTGGTGVIDLDILGGIWDTVKEILSAAKKLLTCTPVQTTTVNVGKDGKITSVTTTSTCVPN